MLVLPGHKNRTNTIAYCPDGRTLASDGADGTVRLWDMASGAERMTIRSGQFPSIRVVWNLDGSAVLAVGYARTIRAWDARTGAPRGIFTRDAGDGPAAVTLIAGAAPGTASLDRLRRAEATAWRLSRAVADRERITYLRGPLIGPGENFPLEARDEPIELGLGVKMSYCQIPTTASGTRFGSHVPGAGISRGHLGLGLIAFSPDGQTLALDRGLGLIEVYGLYHRLFDGHSEPVRSLAFSPDGRTLASGSRDGIVCLWSLADDREPARFDWRIGEINTVAFAPDGSTVAAGGKTGIVVWDVAEGLWT